MLVWLSVLYSVDSFFVRLSVLLPSLPEGSAWVVQLGLFAYLSVRVTQKLNIAPSDLISFQKKQYTRGSSKTDSGIS